MSHKITDVNLKAMISLKNQFGTEVGYSDHTMGIEATVIAVSLGAKIIEKHIFDFKPSVIFTHYMKDVNVDHNITFDSVSWTKLFPELILIP